MSEAHVRGSDIKLVVEDEGRNLLTFANGLCKVETDTERGSGFLCVIHWGSNECVRGMFTTNHVLHHKQQYTMIRRGNKMKIGHDRVECFWSHEKMDLTFVKFTSEFAQILREKGWYYFTVAEEEVAVGSLVSILQNPNDGRACVSNGEVIFCRNDTLLYSASTLHGSSGSPVIDTYYRVIGIHKQRGPQRNRYDVNQDVIYNIGTTIRWAIDLMSNVPKIISVPRETNPAITEGCRRKKINAKLLGVLAFSSKRKDATTQTDDEELNSIQKELEELRIALAKDRVEKETLSDSNSEFDKLVKDLSNQNSELKRSIKELKQRLQECRIQLFQYSYEARRRAETEKFGYFHMSPISCSPNGLFHVETGGQRGTKDWNTEWKRLVEERGGWLKWYQMMPHPVDNRVVKMWLWRRADTLVLQTGYHKNNQTGNAPPHFTIDCIVSVIIEQKDGTSTSKTQQTQHKLTLGDTTGEFVTFSSLNWSSFNPLKPPPLKIQLVNVEL